MSDKGKTRRSSASGSSGSATKQKLQSRTSVDGKADPYDFNKSGDDHPEPLKNLTVERSSFGNVKYSKSAPSTNNTRYPNVEKIAERRLNQSGGDISLMPKPASRPESLSSLNTSGGFKIGMDAESLKGRRKRTEDLNSSTNSFNVSVKSPSVDAFTPKEKKTPGRKRKASVEGSSIAITPSSLNTSDVSTSSKRNRQHLAYDKNLPSALKVASHDNCYKVPEISALEQLNVDTQNDEYQIISAGARVMALWGTDYYAAYVCGRDGLGRYYVLFAEDNLKRPIPPSGVIPIAKLEPDIQVSFITQIDGDEIGKSGVISKQPSQQDPSEWADGTFEITTDDDTGKSIHSVYWSKIYLTKDQGSAFQIKKVNISGIETENIVTESRSTRRGRTTLDTSQTSSQLQNHTTATPKAAGIPKLVSTPKAAGTPKVVATPKPTGTPKVEATPKMVPPNLSAKAKTPQSVKIKTPLTMVEKPPQVTPQNAKTPVNVTSHDISTIPETPKSESQLSETSMLVSELPEVSTTTSESKSPEKATKIDESENKFQESPKGLETPTTPKKNTRKSAKGMQSELPEDNASPSLLPRTEVSPAKAKPDEEFEPEPEPEIEPEPEPEPEVEKNDAIEEDNEEPQEPTDNGVNHHLHALDGETKEDEEMNSGHELSASPKESDFEPAIPKIFDGYKFVLTSAPRANKKTDFNKRDYRQKIEERGGKIIDDFKKLEDGEKAFLIADTYYRTHKYLFALSLSVPCVGQKWVMECVEQNEFIPYEEYLLPAGESSLSPGVIKGWKSLKGTLLCGKTVMVYSNAPPLNEEHIVGFIDIWSPIAKNLGASLVKPLVNGGPISDKLRFFDLTKVDVLLTDSECEKGVADKVEAQGGLVVSSEWIIHAIITGELPDINASRRFRYDDGVA